MAKTFVLHPSHQPAPGDLVVTRVSQHYHIGRAQVDDQPIAAVAVVARLAEALALACQLVTGQQRVFLYDRPGTREHIKIDCANHHPPPRE